MRRLMALLSGKMWRRCRLTYFTWRMRCLGIDRGTTKTAEYPLQVNSRIRLSIDVCLRRARDRDIGLWHQHDN
jgi:hypothetical protein